MTAADRLRGMAAAATDGPWYADEDRDEFDAALHNVWYGDPDKPDLRAVAHDVFSFDDAELIALAPELAVLLADAVEFVLYSDDGPGARAWLARLDALLPEQPAGEDGA